ncbi:MAG: L,D-transpeptidase family protein [Alphaproteobacteria bacterium]|nr:L,D-transpeptidase family protein [Alphaproteobacteria bacterium]OJV45296.1 MAG: hypothetical protein BGO28_00755 [Alphaproteobacteria bacterium 43-37]
MRNATHLFVSKRQLHIGNFTFDVDIGKNGLALNKQEGDYKTPVGTFPLRRVFYNLERVQLPSIQLATHAITRDDGWCDDPASPDYNRLIKLPYSFSHEILFRTNDVYDVFIEVGYNDDPIIPGKGSAIFIHSKSPSGYTAGCIALDKKDLSLILPLLSKDSEITIDEE